MREIIRWKELGIEFRAWFSRAKKMGCKVFQDNLGQFLVSLEGRNGVKAYGTLYGNENKIILKNIHYPKTNTTIHWSRGWNKFAQGRLVRANGTKNRVNVYTHEDLMKFDDVLDFGDEQSLFSKYSRNPEYFRQLTWEEAYSYRHYLCIKSVSIFEKGMILAHDSYWRSERKPTASDLFGWNTELECHLGLATRKDIVDLQFNSMSCDKRKFGCDRGCRDECRADSYNARVKRTCKTLLKIWDELFSK